MIAMRRAGFWKLFAEQYRLCRTRELTRPLGVLHAIKHGLWTAWHRGR